MPFKTITSGVRSVALVLRVIFGAGHVQVIIAKNDRLRLVLTGVSAAVVSFCTLCLWRATQGGGPGSLSRLQLLSYAALAPFVFVLCTPGIFQTVAGRIRTGEIAFDLARPFSPVWTWIGSDLGTAFVNLVVCVPVLLAILLLNGLTVFSATFLMLGCVSLALAYLIIWLSTACLATACFWSVEAMHLAIIKDIAFRILSGALIPTFLLPGYFGRLLELSPLRYTVQACLEIGLRVTSLADACRTLCVQAAWCCILVVALSFLLAAARRRVSIVGG